MGRSLNLWKCQVRVRNQEKTKEKGLLRLGLEFGQGTTSQSHSCWISLVESRQSQNGTGQGVFPFPLGEEVAIQKTEQPSQGNNPGTVETHIPEQHAKGLCTHPEPSHVCPWVTLPPKHIRVLREDTREMQTNSSGPVNLGKLTTVNTLMTKKINYIQHTNHVKHTGHSGRNDHIQSMDLLELVKGQMH